jgi:AraC-like DNA-binding protein
MLLTSGNSTATLDSYWTADPKTGLVFYLTDMPQHLSPEKSAVLSGKSSCLVGLLTQSNGSVRLKGRYRTFQIQFKAHGIYNIFRIPMTGFTNRIFDTEDVFGKAAKEIHEQLANTSDMHQMAAFADRFLFSFLNRRKRTHAPFDGITAISQELSHATEIVPVAQYAYRANMSIRNFERRFSEQIGTSAKVYTKLLRFHTAIKRGLVQWEKGLTSVAYDCGYHDYQHMVKDFKAFTGFTPKAFFEQSDALLKPYKDLLKLDCSTLKQHEKNASNEAFVFVKRVF